MTITLRWKLQLTSSHALMKLVLMRKSSSQSELYYGDGEDWEDYDKIEDGKGFNLILMNNLCFGDVVIYNSQHNSKIKEQLLNLELFWPTTNKYST